METEGWHCFGCGRGGDVFDLVMLKEHIRFYEALCWLARRANIPVPAEDAEWRAKLEERRTIEDVLTLAAEYYRRQLIDNAETRPQREYLRQRGITEDSLRELKIGYASGSGLMEFLAGQGISSDLMLKAELIQRDQQDGHFYEFFRQRIVFPNIEAGRVTYFTGRIIDEYQKPKYLHLPGEKPLFTSTLRRGQDEVILVDGPTDDIALWQWGYSVVALIGTAIKDEWLPQLERFSPIYVCLDSDVPGKEAALVAAKKIGVKSRLFQFPKGVDDPADFVEKGHTQEEFEQLLAKAQDIIEYQIDQIPQNIDRLCIPDRLSSIMEQISRLEPAKAEAYLKHRIGPRFGLRERELGAYRSTISQLRRVQQQEVKLKENKGQLPSEAVEIKREQGKVDLVLSEKANDLLRNPALLYLAGRMIQRLGVAGEDASIRLLYLIVTSRILSNPISATLKGESSSGKSYLAEKVLAVFPPSAYLAVTGMSRQALVYREEPFSHKTIVIFERPGMDAADCNIRTLQSEGKLIFEVAEKNAETNRWETRRVEKEGPTNFIITTTSPELFPENETRHWSMLMDESPRQTLAAKLESAKRYHGGSGVGEDELAIWRQVQTELRLLKVRIPYASWLAEHTPNQPLRMRRDFNRLLALIEVVALLYQRQRHVGEDGILEAGLSDYFIARELADQVFPASLSRINKKVEALVQEVERIYRDKKAKGEADPVVKPGEIANALEANAASVSRWLRPAVEVGLVEVVSETAKGYIRSVKLGNVTHQVSSALPTVEELAEAFPDLARGFKAVHPFTGEELTAQEERATACVQNS